MPINKPHVHMALYRHSVIDEHSQNNVMQLIRSHFDPFAHFNRPTLYGCDI